MESRDDDYMDEIDRLRLEHERLKAKLKEAHTCPVCQQPKMHTRLHGYICRNPEHNHYTDANQLAQWRKENK